MEIRRAGLEDTPAVKALWGYCFERPGDPFFEWYFSKVYRPEDVLVGTVDGRTACDLHLRPYTVQLRGRDAAADYIVGVATHPAARGQGMARELLAEAFRTSRAAGKAVTLLMPSDSSFYRPMGFAFYVHQWEREASPLRLGRIGRKAHAAGMVETGDDWSALAPVYDAYTAGRNGWALRDEASWRRHIAGQLAEGYIAVVYDRSGPSGYLFYSIEERKLIVSEMAFSSESGRRGLYAYMASHVGSVDSCLWYEPIDDDSYLYWEDGAEHTYIKNRSFPYMMLRVNDVEQAFSGIPAAEGQVTFRWKDDVLPELEGCYTVTAQGGRTAVIREGGEAPSFTVDAEAGAELLSGVRPAGALLTEGRIRQTGGGAVACAALAALFPKEKNWINEWY